MKRTQLGWTAVCVVVLGSVAVPQAAAQSWTPAHRLNLPTETQVKEPKLAGSQLGGIHLYYKRAAPTPWAIQYRRFDGNLGPVRTAHTLGFVANGHIIENGDLSVWITWENWATNNEQNWAARTRDGGVTWERWDVTRYSYPAGQGGQAKHPQLTPFLPPEYGLVMATSWRAVQNQLYFNVFNGVSDWFGNTSLGSPTTDNQYAVQGVATSPVDGSVYRTYGRRISNVWQVCLRRFDAATLRWQPEQVVSTNTGTEFVARTYLSINDIGQIMVVWDQNNRIMARFHNGVSWGPQITLNSANHPALCNIPGTLDFYAVYCTPQNRALIGKRFLGLEERWTNAVDVSVGLPGAFTINPSVAADAFGYVYCVWEYWGNDNPQAYGSSLFTPGGPGGAPGGGRAKLFPSGQKGDRLLP